MFAIVGAFTFIGAAAFALLVIVQMVRGYWSSIIAALNYQPMPRTIPAAAQVSRRRNIAPYKAQSFTPRRLEHDRAAA